MVNGEETANIYGPHMHPTLALIYGSIKKSIFCHIFLKPVTNNYRDTSETIILNFKKMENTKKLNQILTRIQIISSIVWAILLIICYQVLGESYKTFGG